MSNWSSHVLYHIDYSYFDKAYFVSFSLLQASLLCARGTRTIKSLYELYLSTTKNNLHVLGRHKRWVRCSHFGRERSKTSSCNSCSGSFAITMGRNDEYDGDDDIYNNDNDKDDSNSDDNDDGNE